MVAGVHVPAIAFTEVSGKTGAMVPAQNGAMTANVARVDGVTVTITSADFDGQVVPPTLTL